MSQRRRAAVSLGFNGAVFFRSVEMAVTPLHHEALEYALGGSAGPRHPPRGLSKLAWGHAGNFSEHDVKMTLAGEAEISRNVCEH